MSKNTFGRKASLLIGLIAFLGLGARAATWTGASQKLVYLTYHTPKGLMLLVR